MTTKQTSPARKTYCVWADHVTRVYQEVEAETPEQAHQLAWEHPESWRDCLDHEGNGYRLSSDVQLAGAEDYFTVVDVEHCETCGSEIVETVNDGNFREGHCGSCEYERYRWHAEIISALREAYDCLNQIPRTRLPEGGTSYEVASRLGKLLRRIDGKAA